MTKNHNNAVATAFPWYGKLSTYVKKHAKPLKTATWERRAAGKSFKFNEYVKAMVFALLSNQRCWNQIEIHSDEIRRVFFDFNAEEILKRPGCHFAEELTKIQCGNRNIGKQMDALAHNLGVLKCLDKKYGSLDKCLRETEPDVLINMLASAGSEYKLSQMGIALVCEFLRNVGLDLLKPDTHIRRILGAFRLGPRTRANASEKEAMKIGAEISKTEKVHLYEIDWVLWTYCAEQPIGLDICGDTPKCDLCVVRNFCKTGRRGQCNP